MTRARPCPISSSVVVDHRRKVSVTMSGSKVPFGRHVSSGLVTWSKALSVEYRPSVEISCEVSGSVNAQAALAVMEGVRDELEQQPTALVGSAIEHAEMIVGK